MAKVYSVFREPCLMEDEGRRFYIDTADTYEEAQEIVSRECHDGYFKPGNFSIIEERATTR